MDQAEFDSTVLKLYPFIPWLEPVAIVYAGQLTEFGCRLCAARLGIIGPDNPRTEPWHKTALTVEDFPKSAEEFADHILEVHLGFNHAEKTAAGRGS